MKTWDYLERVRTLNDGCSDYRIAQIIGVTQPAVVRYRQGFEMADDVALRVAKILGLPAALVMADVNAARAENSSTPEVVAVWKQVAAAFAQPQRAAPAMAARRGGRTQRVVAITKGMVAGDGIEPPTRGFSIPCSTD